MLQNTDKGFRASICIDSETHQVFPNRTRLGPQGRIRHQADFGTTSSNRRASELLPKPCRRENAYASIAFERRADRFAASGTR